MDEPVNKTLQELELSVDAAENNLYLASKSCPACSCCRHGMWLLAVSEVGKKRLRCYCTQMHSASWDSGSYLPNGEQESAGSSMGIKFCSYWQLV